MKINKFVLGAVFTAGLMSINAWGQQPLEDISHTPAFLASSSDIYNNTATPFAGNPQGTLTIVEYYDYQCHYCKASEAGLEQLLQSDRTVKIIFKDFPKLGPMSATLAMGTLAAQRQGADKYLALHQMLLKPQTVVANEDAFYELAGSLGFDVVRLKKDMVDPVITNQITNNILVGKSIGVQMTPTFIVNGHFVPGGHDYNEMQQIIAYTQSASR